MRVCYFGTYDLNYSRNRILIEGLERNGIDVVECHVPLWQGTSDKVAAARHEPAVAGPPAACRTCVRRSAAAVSGRG